MNPAATVKDLARRARRGVHELIGQDLRFPMEVRAPSRFVGSAYGGWAVAPRALPPHPVVFSFGIGRDISFDLGMIQQFDARVYGFDPTPKATQFMHSQTLPPQFTFVEVGLAAHDGTLTLRLGNAEFDSYSAQLPVEAAVDTVECPVERLSTLCRRLNVAAIDVLKMDIEGSEYEAVPDVLASGVPIGQLLVELHYDASAAQLAKARQLVEQIRAAGFALFARSPVGRSCRSSTDRVFPRIPRRCALGGAWRAPAPSK